jgi:hypothetical protein
VRFDNLAFHFVGPDEPLYLYTEAQPEWVAIRARDYSALLAIVLG